MTLRTPAAHPTPPSPPAPGVPSTAVPAPAPESPPPASRVGVGLALSAVYLLWGSTYLAIHFAVRTLPPFTMAGIRFTLAGGILYAILRLRGTAAPERRHWGTALMVGTLLLAVGNGGVSWAQQIVPSGTAALIIAGTPGWMLLFDWLRPGGRRPLLAEVAGLALGMGGIVLLVSGGGSLLARPIHPPGALVLVLASVGWAFGSILSRGLAVPRSPFLLTAMQMLAGGCVLLIMGVVAGEWAGFRPSEVSAASLLALLYLIVFGAWMGYSAYIWLLRETTPAVASSYAFVNPGIAVLLGWLFAGEVVDRGMVGAMALIVVGVALIILRPFGRSYPRRSRVDTEG